MRKYTVRSRRLSQSYLEAFIVTLLIGITLRWCVITPYKIPTNSMAPALNSGDYVFVWKLPYGVHIPFYKKIGQIQKAQKGEVVLFSYSQDPEIKFLKRIAGLPGDKITIENHEPIVVPEGSVFLLGDNKDASDNSQYLGLVPLKNIDGKAVMVWRLHNPFQL